MKPNPHSGPRATVDRTVSGPEKTARIDLGIALMHTLRKPGVTYTRDEIAAYAGCTDSLIFLIEQQAKRKLFQRIVIAKDPFLRELAEHFIASPLTQTMT